MASPLTFFLIISLSFFITLPQTQARVLLSQPQPTPATGFIFPKAESTVLPDPSPFFAPNLLQTPLPTNSFQNFVLNNGDQPEYFHPYHFRSSNSSLSLSYPSRLATPSFISQNFTAQLSISATQNNHECHVVSSFSDLSVTLDFPSSNLTFFLVKGSPYLTCNVSNPTALSISTDLSVTSLSSNAERTKFRLNLDNSQIFLVYSSPIGLTISDPSLITSDAFTGAIRVAMLPPSGSQDLEAILDQFSSSYPISGEAVLTGPTTLSIDG
ncbi:hypothetical protein ACLB2K_061885 [Fragaria x ananassa]